MAVIRSLPGRAALCATLGTAAALALAPLSPASAATPFGTERLLRSVPSVAADVSQRPQAAKLGATAAATGTPPQIAYSVAQLNDSDDGSIASAVARLNPLTGVARTLVADQRRLLTAQAWSDDRFRVYFGLLDFTQETEFTNVDSVSQAGGTPRREVEGALSLDVRRDGQRLVYVREEGETANIFTSNAAGGDERRVTGSGALNARFSPDGSRIVFTRLVGGLENGQADVFTVRADGTGLTRVTGRANTDDLAGAFSPDGSRVLFTRISQEDGLPHVYSVGIDGRGLRLVRANAADPDWASNGWLTYLTVNGSEEDFDTQVAIRAPGIPGAETVLTRERNLVTAVRFAG